MVFKEVWKLQSLPKVVCGLGCELISSVSQAECVRGPAFALQYTCSYVRFESFTSSLLQNTAKGWRNFTLNMKIDQSSLWRLPKVNKEGSFPQSWNFAGGVSKLHKHWFCQSFSRLLHPHEGSPEALGWVEPLIRGHFLVIKAHSEALSGIQEYPRNRHEILRWAGWVRQWGRSGMRLYEVSGLKNVPPSSCGSCGRRVESCRSWGHTQFLTLSTNHCSEGWGHAGMRLYNHGQRAMVELNFQANFIKAHSWKLRKIQGQFRNPRKILRRPALPDFRKLSGMRLYDISGSW